MTLAFGGFFAFSWLRLASVGFSCLHSLIWCKYAWLFASYDSSQICLPIHLFVYIYLSICLFVHLSISMSFFLYFFLSLWQLFFFVFLLLLFQVFALQRRNQTMKEGSKQASCSPLDLVCCWAGAQRPPPPPPPHHEICTSSPTPAPATKSIF